MNRNILFRKYAQSVYYNSIVQKYYHSERGVFGYMPKVNVNIQKSSKSTYTTNK